MSNLADCLEKLDPEVAHAAVLGILHECRWITSTGPEPPEFVTERVELSATDEPGWTYLTTRCKTRDQGAKLRARLCTYIDEFGDEALGVRWELLDVYDRLGVRAPYAGKASGGVGFRGSLPPTIEWADNRFGPVVGPWYES